MEAAVSRAAQPQELPKISMQSYQSCKNAWDLRRVVWYGMARHSRVHCCLPGWGSCRALWWKWQGKGSAFEVKTMFKRETKLKTFAKKPSEILTFFGLLDCKHGWNSLFFLASTKNRAMWAVKKPNFLYCCHLFVERNSRLL